MKEPKVTVDIKADTSHFVKKCDAATKAAERLKAALEAINNTDIVVNVIHRESKPWWKIW